MANTLGAFYHQAAQLQDKDIEKATVLLFVDLYGTTYRLSVKQLKKILKEAK